VVRNGMAQTNNLQAFLDVANVGITGNANLVSQALKLDVTAVLSKDFSQQVGGAGIGGYMNTAVANSQGEIVIPATVTGTLQHPVIRTLTTIRISDFKRRGTPANLATGQKCSDSEIDSGTCREDQTVCRVRGTAAFSCVLA
jgi:hypothetical protein